MIDVETSVARRIQLPVHTSARVLVLTQRVMALDLFRDFWTLTYQAIDD